MQDFMQLLNGEVKEHNNLSYTENGAAGYATTGRSLLDLNFSVAQMRDMEQLELVRRFETAYDEDPRLAMLWLFYLRDIRGGLGERDAFRYILEWLAASKPDVVEKLLTASNVFTEIIGEIIPYYGRWDDLLWLMDTPLKKLTAKVIKKQLESDLRYMRERKPVSLLAKWLPTINGTHSSRIAARNLARAMHLRNADYRQGIVDLRRYIDVVEVKMTDNRWGDIDYERVPSKANLLYSRAFLRHDPERRQAFLDEVRLKQRTINAGVLYPYEVIWMVRTATSAKEIEAYQLAWERIPNVINEENRVLVVCDDSYSMKDPVTKRSSITKEDVAVSTAIYFAERMPGAWHNKIITFSAHPQYIDLDAVESQTLIDKYQYVQKYNQAENTNIEGVFNLILKTAVEHNCAQADLPKTILILSDMEFDRCAKAESRFDIEEKHFKIISEKFQKYGYKLPRIVFWNVGSVSGTFPLIENELGCILVSGFSINILSMVMNGEVDPYSALVKQLTTGRYDPIDVALGYRTTQECDDDLRDRLSEGRIF